MACRMLKVRSQELSAAYLDEIGSRCKGSLLVGGHSKGGNLAVYAAMHCGGVIRRRIRRIYDLDGPGFLPRLRRDDLYGAVKDRVWKIVPHSSVVGMLLEDTGAYEVVESNTFGLLQHNPYSPADPGRKVCDGTGYLQRQKGSGGNRKPLDPVSDPGREGRLCGSIVYCH